MWLVPDRCSELGLDLAGSNPDRETGRYELSVIGRQLITTNILRMTSYAVVYLPSDENHR